MKPGCVLQEIGLQVTVAGCQTSDGSSTECQGSVSGFPGHVHNISTINSQCYSVHCRGPEFSSSSPERKADGFTGSISQQQQKNSTGYHMSYYLINKENRIQRSQPWSAKLPGASLEKG